MTKRYARILTAVPAAVLAAILGGTAVLAATTWTVRPGGPVSMKSGKFILNDSATGAALTCYHSALTGTLKAGSGLPGSGIGAVTAAGWTLCTSPFGFTFTIQARDLPWPLSVSSYHAATGVVTGSLGHLQLGLSLPSCRAVIDGTSGTASDGTVSFSYANGTGRLKLLTTGGNLHFYNVRGCAGLLNTGDPASVSAAYAVSPAQAITSP